MNQSRIMEITRKPVAVCTVCLCVSYDVAFIQKPCSNWPDGKGPCKGVYASALNAEDWKACDHCGGDGRRDNARCRFCQGAGWLYVRNV